MKAISEITKIANTVFNQYKLNIVKSQKTHKNLFILGFESCALKYFFKTNVPKIVMYKDGSWILCEDGMTWEYEADKDYLTTICITEFI